MNHKMKILHICAGWQKWNGAANIARMLMDEQRREGHEVSSATWAGVRELKAIDAKHGVSSDGFWRNVTRLASVLDGSWAKRRLDTRRLNGRYWREV